jgi:hypothetical protein
MCAKRLIRGDPSLRSGHVSGAKRSFAPETTYFLCPNYFVSGLKLGSDRRDLYFKNRLDFESIFLVGVKGFSHDLPEIIAS